jgi:F-type H+-transporting ATPase subunit delta
MTGVIGRNYARALFELTERPGAENTVEADLRAARGALFDDREVRAFLSNRLISRATKKKLVRGAFEGTVDGRLLVLLFLLVERGRAYLLGEITEEFERLSLLARGVRKVTLDSAFPLDAEETARVTRALESRLRSRVELDSRVRPSLIGGVVAASEGSEMEFSIEGRLRDLAERLRGEGTGAEASGGTQR